MRGGGKMATLPFHRELVEIRRASRWPDQEEFAYQLGMSVGGYQKYETGGRLPSLSRLREILKLANPTESVATQILDKWNDVKAERVGVMVPFSRTHGVDSSVLAKRISTEVSFVLKQAGQDASSSVKSTIEKRVLMILKSVLGA
jgi:uncharacterized protein (UPF0254 family)